MAVHDDGTDTEHVGYEPPTIERLGTLAALTQGSGGSGTDFGITGSIALP